MAFTAVPANAEPFVERGSAKSFIVPMIGDPADLLPPAARIKLVELRQRADDASSLTRSVMEAREEQRIAQMDIQARIDRLMGGRGNGGYNLDEDAPLVKEERAKYAKADAEYHRLSELSDLRHAQRSMLQSLVERCEAWLRGGVPGGTALAMYEATAPIVKKGEAIVDLIEAKRRRLRELQAQLHSTRSAPYPSSMAKAKMRAIVEAMIDAGAPNVGGVIERDGEFSWPHKMISARVQNSSDPAAIVFVEVPDAHGLLAFLLKDTLLKALDKEITDCADDASALTDDQLQKQSAMLLGDLLAVEREECALIELLANTQGVQVNYRPDTDPRAFLTVTLVAAPASAPADDDGGWVTRHIGSR